MITPRFQISQDQLSVILKVHLPYIKLETLDYYVEGCHFKLFAKPSYFLRLEFPHEIDSSEEGKGSYDWDTGDLTLTLKKLNENQHFPNLDMLSLLLAPSINSSSIGAIPASKLVPMVQELRDENELEEIEDQDIDWQIEQKPPEPFDEREKWKDTQSPNEREYYYGFNREFKGVFEGMEESLMREVCSLTSPETTAISVRSEIRKHNIIVNWDEEHYIMDFVDDEEIKNITKYQCSWQKEILQYKKLKKADKQLHQTQPQPQDTNGGTNKPEETTSSLLSNISPAHLPFVFPKTTTTTTATTITDVDMSQSQEKKKYSEEKAERYNVIHFTDEENDFLIKLPYKKYMITSLKTTLLGLVDIIFCYAYNERINFEEINPESKWNVAKFSPTLSYFQEHTETIEKVFIECIRQVLCYSLYRNWTLCMRCVLDTEQIFRLGKRKILRCLIKLKQIFDGNIQFELKYYLNNLYIIPFIVFVQSLSSKHIRGLYKEIKKSRKSIKKSDLGLNLEELEQQAHALSDEIKMDCEETQ